MASFKYMGNCTCGNCGGRGVIACRFCDGKGTRTVYKPNNPAVKLQETCGACRGSGLLPCPNDRCQAGTVTF